MNIFKKGDVVTISDAGDEIICVVVCAPTPLGRILLKSRDSKFRVRHCSEITPIAAPVPIEEVNSMYPLGHEMLDAWCLDDEYQDNIHDRNADVTKNITRSNNMSTLTKKPVLVRTFNFCFETYVDKPIERLIADLAPASILSHEETMNGCYVTITQVNRRDYGAEIELGIYRTETDYEFEQRIAKNEEKNRRQRERRAKNKQLEREYDLAELARLKKLYPDHTGDEF